MCVCVCVCDISSLRVNGLSEPGRLRDVCVCQWVNMAQANVKWRACLSTAINL